MTFMKRIRIKRDKGILPVKHGQEIGGKTLYDSFKLALEALETLSIDPMAYRQNAGDSKELALYRLARYQLTENGFLSFEGGRGTSSQFVLTKDGMRLLEALRADLFSDIVTVINDPVLTRAFFMLRVSRLHGKVTPHEYHLFNRGGQSLQVLSEYDGVSPAFRIASQLVGARIPSIETKIPVDDHMPKLRKMLKKQLSAKTGESVDGTDVERIALLVLAKLIETI